MISAFAARDNRAQPAAAMAAEPLDPTLKAPRLHHTANGDLRALTLTPTASSPSPDLLQFPFHKPHLANGDGSRHSHTKPHTSNGDPHRARSYSFHGDHARPALSSKLLPLRRILPFKRRFLVISSFFVLLMLLLLFSIFPTARIYPARMHPFLVDLGEEKERAQANNILDGTLSRTSSYSRYSYTRDRYRHDDHYRDRSYERSRASESRYQRLPIQLSSPRYRPFWAQFRSSLRSWVQNKHYDPHIMTLLLSSVKEPIDRHYLTSNQSVSLGKPYKTCAVVGNSGILLNQTHGPFIDRHDMVMRLNNARISGFEKHVGFKTTLSFVNSNILHSCSHKAGCYCHPYGKNVPLVMYICQVVHLMDVAMCSASLQAPIIVTDARFDTLCARIVKYYSLKRFVEATGQRLEDWSNTHDGPLFHYSSGMQAVLLAVGICEKVSIFGFGKSDNSKHHYHTTQRAELRLHDYGAEYDFYMDLALQNAEIIPFLNEAGFSLPSVHIYW